MIADHRLHHLRILRSTVSVAVYPIQYLAGLPSQMYHRGVTSLSRRNQLLRENAKLRAQQTHLEMRLQKFAALQQENHRLRDLLSSIRHFENRRLLIAELISIDLAPYHQRITLNKGTRHGVYQGQPLLGAKGIIGQIDKVNPFNSIAILISDPNHALLGVIARNGQRSLVVGSTDTNRLELQYLTNTSDVQIGDLVITSGLDDHYPANYPVATITGIQRNPDQTFIKVDARPVVDLNTIREVLLTWSADKDVKHAAENSNVQ